MLRGTGRSEVNGENSTLVLNFLEDVDGFQPYNYYIRGNGCETAGFGNVSKMSKITSMN